MENSLTLGGHTIAVLRPYQGVMIEATDTVEPVKPNVFKWTRVFTPTVESAIPCTALSMELELLFEPAFQMIPSVSYNGNEWGSGLEPRGFDQGGVPFTFAHHRVTVPGCAYAEDAVYTAGIFVDNRTLDCGVSCGIDQTQGGTRLLIRVPEEEMPVTYLRKGQPLQPGYRDTLMLRKEQPLTVTAYIVLGEKQENQAGYSALLDEAWEMLSHPLKPWFNHDELWELGMDYARNELWQEEGDFFGFNIGLSWRDGAWKKRPLHGPEGQVISSTFEAGWCGQNISFGCSFLYDYLQNGNKDSLERGLKSLDSWARNARLPNGLFYGRFHPDYLTNPEAAARAVIDSCNLGAVIENYIEAGELAERCGAVRPEYLKIAKGICDFMIKAQDERGCYPAALYPGGAIAQPDGATGGFIMPGMLWLYAVTHEEAYLRSAVAAFRFYYGQLYQNGFTTAGALDTYCIDKEAAIPILTSALMLYHVTGDAYYKESAVYCGYYLSTWQFHHTVRFPEGTVLSNMKYDTLGGTTVSTQHHHIDAYAVRYIPALLRLGELTGKPLWKQRAEAAWDNATISISDGDYTVLGKRRPRGSQEEAFCQTRWMVPFATSQWCVAWPGAFRLEVLRKTGFFQNSMLPDQMRL